MKSIVQSNWDRCFYWPLCNRPPVNTHHIFGAANRKHSDQDRLVIHVCAECHNEIHTGKRCKDLQDKLHRLGQEKYEALIGTHEEFMKRYGRNWL